MQGLLNVMQREARAADRDQVQPSYAIVDQYDPDTYRARVRFQPEDVLSGWLPIRTMAAGTGISVQIGLAAGDQVHVDFEHGDPSSGRITGVEHGEGAEPVAGVGSGEALLQLAKATVKVNDGGEISITANQAVFKIAADGSVSLQGPEDVLAGVLGGTFRRLIDERLVEAFNAHTHHNTGTPTTPLVLDDVATTGLKGA